MSAELSYDAQGNAELLYVGETPWHREGHKFETLPTWGDLLKVVDYDLEKLPYFYPAAEATPDGPITSYKPSDESFYIQRTDTGARLGSVGSTYEPIPNREAFEVLKPLIDEGVMQIETAGVLREGADAWLLGKWSLDRFGPNVREVFRAEGDHVDPYATVMANHSGRRAVLIGQTPIRIVCANTLGMAESGAKDSSRWATVTHTKGGKVKLVEDAERLFAGVLERYETIAAHYKLLKDTRLSAEEFERLVLAPVVPDPRLSPVWNPDGRMASAVVERFERKRERLKSLWVAGKGHTGEPTAWYGYNAVVEALDHDRDLWPTNSGVYRTAQLLTGEYGRLKNLVLDNLTRHAAGVAA